MKTLLVESSRGRFIPQAFAQRYGKFWEGVDAQELETLKEGPDAEWYWETWDDVLSNATYAFNGDKKAYLWEEDGDLYAVDMEFLQEDYHDQLPPPPEVVEVTL